MLDEFRAANPEMNAGGMMNRSTVLLTYFLACLALCACRSADEFGDDAYPIPMPGQRQAARGDILPSPQMLPAHNGHTVSDTHQVDLSTDASAVESVSQETRDAASRPPVDIAASDTSVPGLPGFCRLEQEGIRAERAGNQITLHFPISNGFEGPIQPTVEVAIGHVLSGVEFTGRARPTVQPGGGVATVVFDTVEQLQLHALSMLPDEKDQKAQSPTPHPFAFETAYRVDYHVDCAGSSADGQANLFSLLKHADLLVHFPARLETGASNKVFGRLINSSDFSPIAEVEALLVATREGKTPVPATAVTDKNGVAVFTLPPLEGGDWQLSVTASAPRGYAPVSPARRNLTASTSGLTRLWLNKPVFSPGDLIVGQLLLLAGPEFRPLKDTPYTLEVRNPDGLRVFKQRGNTPQFGVISFQVPLARHLAAGSYPLALSASDTVEFVYELQVGNTETAGLDGAPNAGSQVARAAASQNPQPAPKTDGRIKLTVDQTILREKSTLKATVRSTAAEGQATVTALHNGIILDHRVVRLQGKEGTRYSLRLPERASGLVTLTASAVDKSSGLQAHTQSVFVFPSDDFKLTVAPTRTAPPPLDKVAFDIATSDGTDRPVASAVGFHLGAATGQHRTADPCEALAMASALASSPALTANQQEDASCPRPLLRALEDGEIAKAERALSALEIPTEPGMPVRTWEADRSNMDRQCSQLVALHLLQRTFELLTEGQIAADDCSTIEARLAELLSQGLPDPWGTGLLHSSEANSIASAGPDQKFGSEDDCLLPIVLPEQCTKKAADETEPDKMPEAFEAPVDQLLPTVADRRPGPAPTSPQFFPALVTGEDGKTQVSTDLAGDHSQFQVIARAVDALGRLAQATLLLDNSSPLTVRAVLPDTVWLGEQAIASIAVTNHQEEPCDLSLEFQGMVFDDDATSQSENLHLEPGASSALQLSFTAAAPGPQSLFLSASSSTGFKSKWETNTFVRETGQLRAQVRSGVLTANELGQNVQERTKLSFPRRSDKRSRSLQIRLFPDALSVVSLAQSKRANEAEPGLSSIASSAWLDLLTVQLVGAAQQDHLTSTEALDGLLRHYQRLLMFKAPKGGLSQWVGENSGGILPTAMALELLSNATTIMPHIDDALIPQGSEFLRGMQGSNATWSAEPGAHEPTLADLQLSCYVLWVLAQAAEGQENRTYLVQQAQAIFALGARHTDRYTDALCLNTLQAVGLHEEAKQVRDRILAPLKRGRQRLSPQQRKHSTTLLNGGPAQEEAETVALLLNACANNELCEDAQAVLMQRLMELQDADGGWASSPWTTAVALRALSRFKPKGHFMAQGNLAISLNGKEIAIARLSDIQAGRPLLLEPPANKIKRTNRIALRVEDSSPGSLAFNIAASHRAAWPKARPKSRLKVSLDCPEGERKAGETFTCSLNLAAPGLDGPRVLHIAVPLDTGVSLPAPGLTSAPVRFWQLAHGELGLIVNRPAPEESLRIPIPLKADIAGEIRLGPVVVTGHFDRSGQGYQRRQRITIR